MALNIKTPAGGKLATQFDEYLDMTAINTKDKMELKRRMLKLYAVLSAACPMNLEDDVIANDLVQVAFNKMLENWGTAITDSNLFRLDYTLPAGAPAIDKLNAYFAAMAQLVDAAKSHKRIMYQDDRLAMVLDSPAVARAMTKLRAGIVERIKSAQNIV